MKALDAILEVYRLEEGDDDDDDYSQFHRSSPNSPRPYVPPATETATRRAMEALAKNAGNNIYFRRSATRMYSCSEAHHFNYMLDMQESCIIDKVILADKS